MKASELRIGNQYQHVQAGVIVLDGEWISYFAKYPELLNGIPLTEEWLLKFGFEKNLHNNYIREYITIGDDKIFIVHPPKNVFNDARGTDLFGVSVQGGDLDTVALSAIKYVHQLQNLYFALTGEELQS
jgi:hypothetical protein